MLESFYRKNYRILYGYLLSLCADPAQAEELTAEAFLKAAERIDSYDPRYKASTWLCTIGRNLYLNEVRRRKRLISLEDAEECCVPSAETLYLQKEQARQVISAARALPPAHRQVLFMRLQGMRFRSIGLALGKTENWARVTYFRAKSRIVSELEGML